jgi:hypothetical protein
MNLTNKLNKTTILYIFICILLVVGLLKYYNYLSNNVFFVSDASLTSLKESFSNQDGIFKDTDSPETSHTVNLPLTTSYGCNNKCGPKSTCSITGEQCTSDVDCYGCQRNINKMPIYPSSYIMKPGFNDAGKLTYNQTPQYSSLTDDIGSLAFSVNQNAKVPRPYQGVDTWRHSYDVGMEIFDKKQAYYNDPRGGVTPHYAVTETTTGEFADYGPLAANATL